MKRLGNIAEEFVIGAFSRETNPNLKNRMVGGFLSMFKTWMFTKVDTRLGGVWSKAEKLGDDVMTSAEGAMRKVEKGADGRWQYGYEGLKKEGSWVTATRVLGESIPFFNEYLMRHHYVSQVRTFGDFKSLSPLERMNMVRASIDLGIFAMAIAMVAGLRGLSDDDDRAKALADHRLVRAFNNGFMTVASTAPNQLFDLATGWAIVRYGQSLIDLGTGQGDWNTAKTFLPGVATVESVTQTVEMFSEEGE